MKHFENQGEPKQAEGGTPFIFHTQSSPLLASNTPRHFFLGSPTPMGYIFWQAYSPRRNGGTGTMFNAMRADGNPGVPIETPASFAA